MFDGVSRIAASLRDGWWDDAEAPVRPLALADLDEAVSAFGGCDIYGWEFIDPPGDSWSQWRDRLSLDVCFDNTVAAHVIQLFKHSSASETRHLDLRIWFDRIRVVGSGNREIPLAEFIAGGIHWWDGLKAGDPRTSGTGIFRGPTASNA